MLWLTSCPPARAPDRPAARPPDRPPYPLTAQPPELKDSLPFTTTFIYGAYEGQLIFWEPMITLDFLQKTQAACLAIRQANAFRESGYYPTQYCVRQDGQGQRTVSLEGFPTPRLLMMFLRAQRGNRPGYVGELGSCATKPSRFIATLGMTP